MPAPVSGVPTPPRSSTFAFFQHQKLENPDSFTCDFHIHDPHPVKRHMDVNWQALLEDGAPLPKRKVDRMSARLDKVHISPGQNPHHTNWRKRHHRRETFEEIEQRLTDSSDDEMSDDNEPCSSKKEKVYSEEQSVQLSDELKKFIKRSIEKPVIIPRQVQVLMLEKIRSQFQ
ncbi:hypothetical protein Tcan_17747 [Toxocara canis]|uniref:Uncharacterized protein n=1 Tax=Toxocara canis TaxID=6265 RepID=A0A0B2W3Q9_TOXCA|nr:hypothetical protein Tcan_17747 [Toxocara canis]